MALGDAEVIRLQTIPGVGPRLSELVVVVIDDPNGPTERGDEDLNA